MLVDNETLCVSRRGGFALYGVICKVHANVASCDETKCARCTGSPGSYGII